MEFPNMCPAQLSSDHNFPMCMTPLDFMQTLQDMQWHYYRPWRWYNQSTSKEFSSIIENDKGNFKITLDVQYFRLNEINVRVTDSEIIVEARHEERSDMHGFVTRQFKRRYSLPKHCPPENVTSTLSSDGILTIIAQKSSTKQTEKIVPIKLCGVCPDKIQIETKTPIEIYQKPPKEDLKDTEDIENNNIRQTISKDLEYSCLLKPEVVKESTSKSNGTCTKTETKKPSPEKNDPLNRIEESIGKSILGLTALTEQFVQNSSTASSEVSGIKNITVSSDFQSVSKELCANSTSLSGGIKNVADLLGGITVTEISGMKDTSERSNTKNMSAMSEIQNVNETSDKKIAADMSSMKSVSEMSDKKSASVTSGMENLSKMSDKKSASDMSGMEIVSEMSDKKSALDMSTIQSVCEVSDKESVSEMCVEKVISKAMVEESASSYMSSSSMVSSTSVSGKTLECVTDIREELRQAAENV